MGEYINAQLHDSACVEHKLLSMRTSAKTGENVAKAFETLVVNVHNHFKTMEDEKTTASRSSSATARATRRPSLSAATSPQPQHRRRRKRKSSSTSLCSILLTT